MKPFIRQGKLMVVLSLLFIFSGKEVAWAAAAPPNLMKMKKQQQAIMQGQQPSQGQQQAPQAQQPQPSAPASPQEANNPSSRVLRAPAENPSQNPGSSGPVSGAANQDFTLLVQDFKSSSKKWMDISDAKLKELIIYYFISEYADRGIKINKGASHYADLINDLARQNTEMLERPMEQILQLVAIIEYDFDNGQDKDAMARKILGETEFLRNKERQGR